MEEQVYESHGGLDDPTGIQIYGCLNKTQECPLFLGDDCQLDEKVEFRTACDKVCCGVEPNETADAGCRRIKGLPPPMTMPPTGTGIPTSAIPLKEGLSGWVIFFIILAIALGIFFFYKSRKSKKPPGPTKISKSSYDIIAEPAVGTVFGKILKL